MSGVMPWSYTCLELCLLFIGVFGSQLKLGGHPRRAITDALLPTFDLRFTSSSDARFWFFAPEPPGAMYVTVIGLAIALITGSVWLGPG